MAKVKPILTKLQECPTCNVEFEAELENYRKTGKQDFTSLLVKHIDTCQK